MSERKVDVTNEKPEVRRYETIGEEIVLPAYISSRWSLILRGIFGIIIGLLLLRAPYMALWIITTIIGVFMVVDAILIFAAALSCRKCRRGFGILYALLVFGLGMMIILYPLLMNFFWIILIGVWLIIDGINQMTIEGHPHNSGWIKFSGVISLIVGILFIIWPFAGLSAILLVSGVMLIAAGIISIIAGITTHDYRLRRYRDYREREYAAEYRERVAESRERDAADREKSK